MGLRLLAALCLLANTAVAQTYSKTETIEYDNNTAKWVLGQVKRTTTDGIETSRTVFDSNSALPLQMYTFNSLDQTLTYDTSSTVASGQLGTLKTVKDGKNNITTLSNWKRGIQQNIKFPITPESPAGAVLSAVVNDNGLITSVTDQNGFVTNYGYDPMGRLASITYPPGDTVAWLPTTQVFEPVAATEYGIPATHWRQTTTTGNARKITYFDAMWRPLVTHEYDAANVAGTQRFQRFAYDANGQLGFASYHGTADSLTTGTWSLYDALGRLTSLSQDSELGMLTTTTEYLSGFRTRVTNPRGLATVTTYQVFDSPNTNSPLVISLPEGVWTTITRDNFGKPKSVSRNGMYAGENLGVTRYYVYDGNERLCKSINPESGAALVDYDLAGNVAWSADGTGLTRSLTCDRSSVTAGEKTFRTYDAMNRVTAVDTPGGTADLDVTYYADGKVNTLTAANPGGNNVQTSYTYNRRRMLTREQLQVNALLPWGFDYTYNANGHLSSQTYPGALVVGYAPDALGRPTQAGTFATGVTYYPNGAMSGFTYGNGIVHTMTQNARKLPARSLDAYGATKVLDDSYTYDANGNVLSMVDASSVPLAENRTWGIAVPTIYDGLDRLLAVRSTYQWGAVDFDGYNANYSYDPLDNLRMAFLGSSNYIYGYNGNNQLATLNNGQVTYTITTDVAGNVTGNTRSNQSFEFDSAHRMSAVTGKESYLYDGNGRRARTLNSTTGTIEYFGYGADGRLLADWSNRRQVRNQYIYLGNTLVGLNEVSILNFTVAPRYKHTDALGSPVATTDAGKNVTGRTVYAPYGVPMTPVDGVGYTGHFNDLGTGLTYMQQRYYDPQIGRFLSVDPVAARAIGDNFNRYAYANSNPYRFADPDGRDACPSAAAGTCFRADTFDAAKSNRTSIRSSDGKDQVVKSMIPRMTSRSPGVEKMGFVVKKDGQDAPKYAFGADSSKTTSGTRMSAAVPKNATVVVHSHSDVNMDMSTAKVGLADSEGLVVFGLPVATINDGRAGIRELIDGRLQFRMVQGTLRPGEIELVQANMNREQSFYQEPAK